MLYSVAKGATESMRVRLNIGLDFDGNHTFEWQASSDPGAVDIPRTTLERWAAEREAFTVAYLRWRRVMEEIEDTLYRADSRRAPARIAPAGEPAEGPAVAVATVSAKARVRPR